MTAKDIVEALERNHAGCITMPEATIGSSFGEGSRIDFWAMKPTWADIKKTWAYEIKVSRSDFKSDTKWPRYVPYCSRFYFICPWGLIDPKEIESPAGLCWVDAEGIVHIKKRAKVRVVEKERLYTMLMRWCFKVHFVIGGISYKSLYEKEKEENEDLRKQLNQIHRRG